MEQKDKLRIVLDHWIEHNKGHAKEYAKWASISREEGLDTIAGFIDEAIGTMAQTNDLLAEALGEAGGKLKSDKDHHHHH